MSNTLNETKKAQSKERQKLNESFASRLDERRIELELNKVQVGRYCDVSKVTASQWFNGHVKPSFENINKLAKVLETTSDYLLYGEIKYTKGIDPKIMKAALRIVRQSEIFSGQMYSVDKFSSQVLSVCHKLNNKKGNIKITSDNSFISKAVKIFIDDFNGSEDDFESALNKACLSVANP